MAPSFFIDRQRVGDDAPVYIVAEMSTNHGGSLTCAKEIIHAAAEAGADAIKLQSYNADSLTLNSSDEHFQLRSGLWKGQSLYELYDRVAMPWEWHEPLFAEAKKAGITLFSSPFDKRAVDLLKDFDAPAYKIASAESIDDALLHEVAATGKPVIISTGGSSIGAIQRAANIMQQHGNEQVCFLKCTSAYPAPYESMNLRTIPHLAALTHSPVGLSDHTLGINVPLAAVALGACFIEKHFMLDKSHQTADRAFSLDPDEFSHLVTAIHQTSAALGDIDYPAQTIYQRAVYVIKDLPAGTVLQTHHLRSARPGGGIPPKYLDVLIGRTLRHSVKAATALQWSMV